MGLRTRWPQRASHASTGCLASARISSPIALSLQPTAGDQSLLLMESHGYHTRERREVSLR